MGRLVLWIVLVVLALVVAGAGYLMFADVPAPVTTMVFVTDRPPGQRPVPRLFVRGRARPRR